MARRPAPINNPVPIDIEEIRNRRNDDEQACVAATERVLKRMEQGRQAPLLYVKVKNERKWLMAMVDSGAEVNVVGKDLLQKIQHERLADHPLRLCGCGGQSCSSRWVRVPLEFANGLKIQIDAIVGSEFGTALILGGPFLHGQKIGIEYEGCFLRTAFGEVSCIEGPELNQSNAKVGAATVEHVNMSEKDQKVLEELIEKAQVQPEEKEKLRELLLEYGDLWIGNPRGRTDVLQHEVRLTSQHPIREKPRRFTPDQLKAIDDEVETMLRDGVIQPSCSPYAFDPHLVKKKTQDWRFCVDFRRLNDITIADEWPMPRIQDLIRSVRNSKYIVGLNLRSGINRFRCIRRSCPIPRLEPAVGYMSSGSCLSG